MENEILDIIISLINGVKAGGHIESDGQILWGSKYLLNQTIRQYSQPNDHYFISEKALDLWNKITSEDIMSKYYRDRVILDKTDGTITLKCYKGNSKHFTEWTPNKGDGLTYRDVFHDEHIVPVKMIIKELIALEHPNYENVKEILGKIRVCKMLKEEDKLIKNKSNRSTDYKKAIADNYSPQIVCINVVTGEKL